MTAGLAGMSRGEAWRQRSWRHVTVAISIALHVAVGLVAIAYSFWHVEELSPPSVTVTFVSAAAAPPPPPPPPPLGGQGSAAKRRPVSRPRAEVVPVGPTPPEVPHPPVEMPVKAPVAEAPKDPPAPPTPNPTREGSGVGTAPGVKGGVAGGVAAGVAGGVVGGAVGAPPRVAPKFLPPQLAAQLKLSGSADPDFPAVLRRPGASFVVVAKICVSVAGGVESVTVQKHADPSIDNNVVTAVKGWRFRPATANGAPIPFCYLARFEFKSD